MATKATSVALPDFDRETHTQHPPRMSFEEFVRWVPDGVQAEWVDGEVIILTVSLRHAELSILLASFLKSFVSMLGLGDAYHAPFLMRARAGGPGREPDIFVVLHEHRDRFKRIMIEGPVDVAVELLSEETARTDRVRKLREYEAAGVSEYLIVEAREGREGFWFHRLDAEGRYQPVQPDAASRYHSTLLPGLWLDPRWFAEDPLPSAERLLLEVAPEAYLERIAALRGEIEERGGGG